MRFSREFRIEWSNGLICGDLLLRESRLLEVVQSGNDHSKRKREMPDLHADDLPNTVIQLCQDLPSNRLLHLEVDSSLTMICSKHQLLKCSRWIQEALAVEDEQGSASILTIHFPFAASFPHDEVVAFFKHIHDGQTSLDAWKLSWTHLADYLQMTSKSSLSLDRLARQLWKSASFHNFTEWVLATRLVSMQRRKPEYDLSTASDQNLVTRLSAAHWQDLESFLDHDFTRFQEMFGVDILVEVLLETSRN